MTRVDREGWPAGRRGTPCAARCPPARSRARSPASGVGHGRPGLPWRKRTVFLQQLDGDVVGRAHEGHAAITRRAIDQHTVLLQSLASGVNVVHGVGQVTEVAAAAVTLGLPVVRELYLRGVITRRRQEDQRELSLRVVVALDDFES